MRRVEKRGSTRIPWEQKDLEQTFGRHPQSQKWFLGEQFIPSTPCEFLSSFLKWWRNFSRKCTQIYIYFIRVFTMWFNFNFLPAYLIVKCLSLKSFSAISVWITFAIAICFSVKFSYYCNFNFRPWWLCSFGLNICYAVSIRAAVAIATCFSIKFGSSHLLTAL